MQNLPDVEPVQAHLQALLERGVKWQRHGLTPASGLGCYGLIRYAYALAGVVLPGLARDAELLFAPCVPPYRAWDVAACQLDEPHLALLLAPYHGFHIAACTNGLAHFNLRDSVWRRRLVGCHRYRGFLCS